MQGKSRGVEVVRGRRKVVDVAGYDVKHPRTEENERGVDMNALRRDKGPGGHRGKPEEVRVESGDVEDNRERHNDGDGIEMSDGRPGAADGATSGAGSDSKRVDTRLLAGDEGGQLERRNRTTAHVPEPSTPAPEYPRRSTDQPNPPRRRGRLKTKHRRVSRARSRKSTHQAIQSH